MDHNAVVSQLLDALYQIRDLLRQEHALSRFPGINAAIEHLESADSVEQRCDAVRSIFKDWGGSGGFFDYGIWREDEVERLALNAKLDRHRGELWRLLGL